MGNKRKRQKKRDLTQEEVWDDSALIQSWDDAVEEYKLYHSIQARGENVEDVLREAEAQALAGDVGSLGEGGKTAMDWHPVPDRSLQNGGGMGDSQAGVHEPENMFVSEASEPHGTRPRSGRNGVGQNPFGDGTTSMPKAIFGQTPASNNQATGMDAGLKNLMMSWYYAGYYTGLYEGQQKANQR